MTPRHLVDPELAPILPFMPAFGDLDCNTLPGLRAAIDAAAKVQLKSTDMHGVLVRDAHATRVGGAVRVVIYSPEASPPLPALLHFHGGGMVMGRPEMQHESLVRIARELSCLVCSVDYRLAPEHPYPAAIDDAFTALAWLHDEANNLGVDRERIAVAGESAGAGLAASLAILARDRGGPKLSAQMLSYPMLDDRTADRNPSPSIGEFVWNARANHFCWTSYLGEATGGRNTSAYAAAARVTTPENLPPAFIGIGALDLFLEETLVYALRLARSGVSVEAHVYPGAFHGFDAVPDAAVSATFRGDWQRAFRRAFDLQDVRR